MKRCPECGRDYNDDSLSFCLDDGAELLFGPAKSGSDSVFVAEEEPATAILPAELAQDLKTEPQIHTTQRTEVLPAPARKSRSPIAALAVAAVLVVAVAGSYVAYRYFSSSNRIDSIAVLPLQNNSGNADSEYLADGLAESLIYRLSQLPDLKVSPASSVMRYKGKEFDAQKIAADLGVRAVMSGRMIQRGDNLSISVELIDAVNNKTIWGEQFERKMSDLIATQREIATTITEKLQLKLTGSQTTSVTKKYTENNEAYNLYLKGRFYWNKRTEADINRSIDHFKQAIALDPNFALAYSGLADAYHVLPNYRDDPKSDETYPLALETARKALELDATLADPHTTIAVVLHEYDWKFKEAEVEFKRAIELNPNYPSAHQWYGEFLANMGRPEEAIAELKRAQELDPLSLIINSSLATMYYCARRHDEAIQQHRRTLEIDPNFIPSRDDLAFVYAVIGMYEEALDETRKLLLLEGEPPEDVENGVALVRQAYRTSGPKGFWQKRMEIEIAAAREENKEVPPVELATLQMGAGDKHAALSSLEQAVGSGRRYIGLVQLNGDPLWDPIRAEPRFKELLRKIGFP